MTVRRLGSLAVVLLVAGLVFGQGGPKKDPKAPKEPSRPAPGSLEDTLEKALRNSADIKAAEAKVRDAEAELNRVRHQVLTRATALHSDLNLAKRMLAVAEESLKEAHRLATAGRESSNAILTAQAMVEKHRGELEKLEAELKALRGEFAIKGVLSVAFDPNGRRIAGMMADGEVQVWDATDGTLLSGVLVEQYLNASRAGRAKATAVVGSMAERVKRLLDQEIQMDHDGTAIPSMIHEILAIAKADVPVRVTVPRPYPVVDVGLKGKLPVGAWMQVVEDSAPEVRIVVRDYGLLLTTRDKVPEGALRVEDLWKGNYAQLKKAAEPKEAEKK